MALLGGGEVMMMQAKEKEKKNYVFLHEWFYILVSSVCVCDTYICIVHVCT